MQFKELGRKENSEVVTVIDLKNVEKRRSEIDGFPRESRGISRVSASPVRQSDWIFAALFDPDICGVNRHPGQGRCRKWPRRGELRCRSQGKVQNIMFHSTSCSFALLSTRLPPWFVSRSKTKNQGLRLYCHGKKNSNAPSPLTFDLPLSLIGKLTDQQKKLGLKSTSEVVRQAIAEYDYENFEASAEEHRQISVRLPGGCERQAREVFAQRRKSA